MTALLFVVDALLTLVVVAFLLRVLMPLTRADFRSPIGQAVLRFTSPVVMPLRRLLPPAGRVDVASIVALLLVQLTKGLVLRLVAGGGFALVSLVPWVLRDLGRTVLQFYFVVILLHALLSWVGPRGYGPGADLLTRLAEPLLAPLRRIIPPLGGLDLSPLFVLIGLQALQILLR